MLKLDERTIHQLLNRYRKATRADIEAILRRTECWLMEHVEPVYLLPGNIPPQFNAIAILKVHGVFGPRPSRNAATFSSWDLITGFQRQMPKSLT